MMMAASTRLEANVRQGTRCDAVDYRGTRWASRRETSGGEHGEGPAIMSHRRAIAGALLALLLMGCGGGESASAPDQFVTAWNAFGDSVNASVGGMNATSTEADLQAAMGSIGAGAATFSSALGAISFPDKAKADETTLARAVVTAQQRAVAASRMTGTGLTLQVVDIRAALQAVADAGAQVRNDLGLPAPS
jgi:hypothetical protein